MLDMLKLLVGSFDGAEICVLVGLYILTKLEGRFGKKNVGFYRDDRLAIIKINLSRLI